MTLCSGGHQGNYSSLCKLLRIDKYFVAYTFSSLSVSFLDTCYQHKLDINIKSYIASRPGTLGLITCKFLESVPLNHKTSNEKVQSSGEFNDLGCNF